MRGDKARSSLEIVLDADASRVELETALTNSAIDTLTVLHNAPIANSIYLVGTGFDFSEFGAQIAAGLSDYLVGVGCIWTERSELPLEEAVFSIPQHFIETISDHLQKERRLLLTQSIIADKMEVMAILARIMKTARPTSVVIASVAINERVKEEIRSFLLKYFPPEKVLFLGAELGVDLEATRDSVADKLDDRELRLIPIMSSWLLERRFGPKPEPVNDNAAGFGPGD